MLTNQVDDGQNTPGDLKRGSHPQQPNPAGDGHAASSSYCAEMNTNIYTQSVAFFQRLTALLFLVTICSRKQRSRPPTTPELYRDQYALCTDLIMPPVTIQVWKRKRSSYCTITDWLLFCTPQSLALLHQSQSILLHTLADIC